MFDEFTFELGLGILAIGVSIGTLYQYFPGKDALIGALMDRQIEKNIVAIELRRSELRDCALPEALSKLCQNIVELFKLFLDSYPEVFKSKDTSAQAFIVVQSVMGVIQYCGLAGLPPGWDRSRLAWELEKLLVAYLLPGAPMRELGAPSKL